MPLLELGSGGFRRVVVSQGWVLAGLERWGQELSGKTLVPLLRSNHHFFLPPSTHLSFSDALLCFRSGNTELCTVCII